MVTAGAGAMPVLFVKGVFSALLSVLQVFIQNPGGPDSAWNLPDELSVGQAVQIRVSPQQGATKRCRLSWLTNSALVYEPIRGERGGGGGGVSVNSYRYGCTHGAQINFGDLTPL